MVGVLGIKFADGQNLSDDRDCRSGVPPNLVMYTSAAPNRP